jgi:ribosomal protein L35
MELILVPGPPPSAFNKHRRVSDLIKKQVEHFKHLEEKLSAEERAKLPNHAVVTEDDAARYIAAFTRHLLAKKVTPASRKPIKMNPRSAKQYGLAIAAAADTAHASPKKTTSRPKKKSASANKRKK